MQAGPAHVLVLDDSRAQRRLLATLLRRWGHPVTVCETPGDALEALTDHSISIILTDWMMPGMTGPEFTRAFRRTPREGYAYVILLTSKSEKAEIAHGLDAGADDFVSKPVDPHELRARMRAGIRIIEMQRELVWQNQRVRSTLAEIRGLYDALDRDLLEAKRLQDTLVRERFRQFDTGSIALTLRSSGHVGGDLIGFFPIDATRIGLFSLDVSGHGVTSALLAARMAALLGTAAPEQNVAMVQKRGGAWDALPPDRVAAKLNRMMFEEIETDLYFTLALAYLDLTTGAVQMVQAGHPHPAVLRPDGAVTWVGEGGMPIGLLEEAQFDSVTFHLEPGDRLMLYSDGITECENRAGEEFGEDGLAALLRRTAEDQGEALLETIVTAVQDFSGRTEFADDVSLVAFDFTGPSAA
ncbi:PP2C family protein-serine/threonine phosphatase [Alterinioella nitratireducens]|uniref:PP2C family protein-serine/threonine phosphatase n=1 Tax=Alterinioella nitratireducens TaxID=2735915 RepID=UPI0040598278